MKTLRDCAYKGASACAVVFAMAGIARGAIFIGADLNADDAAPLPRASRTSAMFAESMFLDGLSTVSEVSLEMGEGYVSSGVFPAPEAGLSVDPVLRFGDGLEAALSGGIIRFQAEGTSGPMVQPSGRYAADGEQYVAQTDAVMTIVFDVPQMAFGFWGVDIGDFDGTLTVEFDGPGGSFEHSIDPVGVGGVFSGSIMFWGMIDVDRPFTSVSFRNSNHGPDVFAFDLFRVGTPVPGPGAGWAGAMLGAIVLRRRRRC